METRISSVSENVQKQEKYAADLDQALTVAGVGFYNLKYALVLALFLIAAIIEPVGYSYVLPAAKCDLHMTDAQRGFIASIPYIGIFITSFPMGYLVDTMGRKTVVVWSSTVCGVFASLAGFMPELISFATCKFISALCIAGAAAVPYAFIGEIVPPKHKDFILSIVNALQITGSALVPMIAWAVLPLDFKVNFGLYDFRPWRLLTIIYGFFFLLAAFLMSFGPESPKYLMARGRNEEALQALETIYAGNHRKPPESYPVKMLKITEKQQDKELSFLKSLKVQSVPLIRPPYLKWMVLNSFLLFGVYATLNGLYLWVPDILNRVLTGDTSGLTACQIIAQRLNETAVIGACDDTITTSTFIINIVANSACAVIAVVGSSAVKIVGKKLFLVIVYTTIGTFCALVNVITKDIVFIIFLSSIPVMGMALGPINAYAVEIFPTQLRGMAVVLCMMLGRTGSVVGINVAGLLLNLNCAATFYVFGGSLIFCALLSILLPRSQESRTRETKINDTEISTRL